MMSRNELSMFFNLTKVEQSRVIQEAQKNAIQRHGKVAFWTFWVTSQLLAIAGISFLAGFGIAAFFYLVGAQMPDYRFVGVCVGLAAVFVWPVLSLRGKVFLLSSQISQLLQAKQI